MTGLNAPTRSKLGVYKRSKLGVRRRGVSEAGPGNILLLDVGGDTLVYSHETGTWGELAPTSLAPYGVVWIAGVLYGWRFNQVYQYDPNTDTFIAYGDPFPAGENVRQVIEYQGQPVVAYVNSFDIVRWTGSEWESVAFYSVDSAVHPFIGGEATIPCDDVIVFPPETQCIRGEEDDLPNQRGMGDGVYDMIVKAGTLFYGGFYWFDWTVPNSPDLNSNPLITDPDGEPTAIFEQYIRRIVDGPGNLMFVELNVGSGDKARWRDAWPGCCTTELFPNPHYGMIEANTGSRWVAVQANTTFAASNVVDYFGNMTSEPFIVDLRTYNDVVYGSLIYSTEQVIITTYDDHGLSVGDFIEINGAERYEQPFAEYEVLEIPLPNEFVIDRQFRGSERCGFNRTQPATPSLSGTIIDFRARLNPPISGLYRWEPLFEDWVPAFEDNQWPEGIPGAYPMIQEDGPGYIRSEDLQDRFAFDISSDGGLYFMSRAIPSGDGDSFERLDLTTLISQRLCFPELSFPNPVNPFRRIQALPPGATLGTTPNSCFGDSVTNKFSINDVDSTILTATAPHGLDGAGRIVIENSTVPDYNGAENIMEIVSPTQIRVRETFQGTASGDFYHEEDPNNVMQFNAVADGGPWTYWFVFIELGTDRRPADLVLEGQQSGNIADFTNVPYDFRERVLVASTPPGGKGSRRVRYDRFGDPSGPNTTHYYQIEYPQAADPGWIEGEPITIRRP